MLTLQSCLPERCYKNELGNNMKILILAICVILVITVVFKIINLKNIEYKEPEFKVVVTKTEDVITTSILPDTNTLTHISKSWEIGTFSI